MRPVLKTALRRLWRDPTTLQIGVRADHAVVVAGVDDAAAHLVEAIDGTRDDQALRLTARSLGLEAAVADALLRLLGEAAVLDDAMAADPLTDLPAIEQERLTPDLASASLVSGRPGGGPSTLTRRRRAKVTVVGAGRVGGTVAAVLAAAGIGQVAVDDPGTCRPRDCGPVAPRLADVGATRGHATRTAISRISGVVSTDDVARHEQADVAVLAPSGSLDPAVPDELVRAGVPHLLAHVREATGVVGPFVLPGRSACLRCLDLHRTDRDPAWPMIAAQLAVQSRRSGIEACDVALATFVGAVCALQVLGWVDRGDAATRNGTLELTLPDWRIRRRSWHPHPACGCRWDADHATAEAASEPVPAGRGDPTAAGRGDTTFGPARAVLDKSAPTSRTMEL